jgi:hypothetical protein
MGDYSDLQMREMDCCVNMSETLCGERDDQSVIRTALVACISWIGIFCAIFFGGAPLCGAGKEACWKAMHCYVRYLISSTIATVILFFYDMAISGYDDPTPREMGGGNPGWRIPEWFLLFITFIGGCGGWIGILSGHKKFYSPRRAQQGDGYKNAKFTLVALAGSIVQIFIAHEYKLF